MQRLQSHAAEPHSLAPCSHHEQNPFPPHQSNPAQPHPPSLPESGPSSTLPAAAPPHAVWSQGLGAAARAAVPRPPQQRRQPPPWRGECPRGLLVQVAQRQATKRCPSCRAGGGREGAESASPNVQPCLCSSAQRQNRHIDILTHTPHPKATPRPHLCRCFSRRRHSSTVRACSC